MTPEARLFAMTFALVLLAGVFFGLAHLGVWLQKYEARRAVKAQPLAPAQVSSVSVETAPLVPADEQTDEQTDPSVSALFAAAERLRLDKTRGAILDTLVLAEWGVGDIRAVLKSDNNRIGAEVEAARKRLNMAPESREIIVRTHENGERLERTIPL